MSAQQAIVTIDDESASLKFHPQYKIVHHELRAFIHGARLRTVLDKGLELFQQHGATKWLSDDRGNGPLTEADTDWCLNDWAPRVLKAGWKFWAVVMPTKVIGQMNMKRWIATYAEQGVTARAFSDPDEAFQWLKAQ
jgi:hypothetical protein